MSDRPPPRAGTAPSVICPTCEAGIGEHCRGRRGSTVDYHWRRRDAARENAAGIVLTNRIFTVGESGNLWTADQVLPRHAGRPRVRITGYEILTPLPAEEIPSRD